MTKKNPQDADAFDSGPGQATPEAIDGDAPEDQDPVTALRAERDDLEQRLLRVSADYQNFVRRSEQNLQSARQHALIDVTKAILAPLDHFDRAMDVDPQTTTAEALLKGVQIVRDELIKSLGRFGVQRVEVSPGDEFDPNRHEALSRMPVPGIEEGRIAAQLQPGYTLGQTTLRPAQVMIAQSPAAGPTDSDCPDQETV